MLAQLFHLKTGKITQNISQITGVNRINDFFLTTLLLFCGQLSSDILKCCCFSEAENPNIELVSFHIYVESSCLLTLLSCCGLEHSTGPLFLIIIESSCLLTVILCWGQHSHPILYWNIGNPVDRLY